MAQKRGREVLVDALVAEGVKFIFGIPGGQSIDILYDALYGASNPRAILVRHEQSAPFMAYAHSRLHTFTRFIGAYKHYKNCLMICIEEGHPQR